MQRKEFETLVLLEKERKSLTQRELATALGVSLGTANTVSKNLTTAGYIADGAITPAGIEALEPYRVKRAIFLAAGFGSRMVPLTFNTPKPLIRRKQIESNISIINLTLQSFKSIRNNLLMVKSQLTTTTC